MECSLFTKLHEVGRVRLPSGSPSVCRPCGTFFLLSPWFSIFIVRMHCQGELEIALKNSSSYNFLVAGALTYFLRPTSLSITKRKSSTWGRKACPRDKQLLVMRVV